jgi:hypothetical protein
MTSPPAERLSPAHLTWLKQFSIVMHRWYSYPPKHPSRVASQELALVSLALALEAQGEIVIAVSRHQLSVGGVFSDVKNPALGELAERLHRHGIGTITLRDGIGDAEFDALLERITRPRANDAADEEARERPIGPHVAVEMLSYDGLALSEEDADDARGPDGTGDRLWRELAEFALTGWDGVDDFGEGGGGGARPTDGGAPGAIATGEAVVEQAPPPADRRTGVFSLTTELPAAMNARSIAGVINARAGDPQFAKSALQSLIKIGRHARKRGRAGGGAVAARLRETMQALDPDTLKSLLFSEKDPARQRLLFLQGVDALPVSAVLDWIEAAAGSSGQSISQHLLRLLRKLSSQTRRRRDAGPDEGGEALREAARQLIDNWYHEINETDEHTELLEQIAAYDSPDAPLDAGEAAGSDRLLQIALETEAMGADVLTAVDRMIESRRIGRVLSSQKATPMLPDRRSTRISSPTKPSAAFSSASRSISTGPSSCSADADRRKPMRCSTRSRSLKRKRRGRSSSIGFATSGRRPASPSSPASMARRGTSSEISSPSSAECRRPRRASRSMPSCDTSSQRSASRP